MPCYRLEPVAERRDDPRWHTSDLKEGCWITANSEDEARTMIAHKTVSFYDRYEGGGNTPHSAWREPLLATCEIDLEPPHGAPPRGVILTFSGETIS